MTSTTLNIAHFNDVYQVSEQKIKFSGQQESIDVTKFAGLLDGITSKWNTGASGSKDGLVIFSGDLFSPSIESSVTRGKHIPAIISALGVDVGVIGNHEFDFGYPQLQDLLGETDFPFLLSNIVDNNTGKPPAPAKEFLVLERAGLRIGLVGLVEKDWIATINSWPTNFVHKDMVQIGTKLSRLLRDPAGEYKCDVVFAITHCRIPNDIQLARDLLALSPSAQASRNIASEHGIDLVLGGHDHIYWIPKGVTQWTGYDVNTVIPDAVGDHGDVLIVKSGTDYQDISNVVLTLVDAPAGSVRKKIIKEIRGERCSTRGDSPVNQTVKVIFDKELATLTGSLREILFKTAVQLDVRSPYIRVQESPIANWVVDTMRHSYDASLEQLGHTTVDAVLLSCGNFRGDRVYDPGPITLGDLISILPYVNPMVVLEIGGSDLWDALESGLSKYPSQEGRFPAISGIRVAWDGSKPAGQRVDGIWLLEESDKIDANGNPALIDKEEVLRNSTRKYLLMANEYMAEGGDGYDVLKDKKRIIDGEAGKPMSTLVREFISGAHFLKQKTQEAAPTSDAKNQQISRKSLHAVSQHLPVAKLTSRFSSIASEAVATVEHLTISEVHSAAYAIANHVDLGLLDPYERHRVRKLGKSTKQAKVKNVAQSAGGGTAVQETDVQAAEDKANSTLYVIHPVVDGRSKNASPPQAA